MLVFQYLLKFLRLLTITRLFTMIPFILFNWRFVLFCIIMVQNLNQFLNVLWSKCCVSSECPRMTNLVFSVTPVPHWKSTSRGWSATSPGIWANIEMSSRGWGGTGKMWTRKDALGWFTIITSWATSNRLLALTQRRWWTFTKQKVWCRSREQKKLESGCRLTRLTWLGSTSLWERWMRAKHTLKRWRAFSECILLHQDVLYTLKSAEKRAGRWWSSINPRSGRQLIT